MPIQEGGRWARLRAAAGGPGRIEGSMDVGVRTIEKAGGAWLASLAFCLVFLAGLLAGVGPWTVLGRSLLAAFVAFLCGRFLTRYFADVVLEALAEHRRRKEEERRKKEEEEVGER